MVLGQGFDIIILIGDSLEVCDLDGSFNGAYVFWKGANNFRIVACREEQSKFFKKLTIIVSKRPYIFV